jgi:5-(carboxyamino)imidazole ribonucleotide mutase
MPGGIPVATVAVGKAGAKNAAYLAAQILAVADDGLHQVVVQDRSDNRAKVEAQNASVQASLES